MGDEEVGLFSVGPPLPSVPKPDLAAAGVADWQVAQIRAALDRLGLVEMDARQSVLEAVTGRSLSSLRDLQQAEFASVIERLAKERPQSGRQGSAWDDREGDTWIDRL